MKKDLLFLVVGLILIASPGFAFASVLDELIATYQSKGPEIFSAKSGEALWREKHLSSGGQNRSCASCHGDHLRNMGKHIKTKKKIKPMALSVNVKPLTDAKFIEKWFKRNCQWTWGRECTAAEKGQILIFLKGQ